MQRLREKYTAERLIGCIRRKQREGDALKSDGERKGKVTSGEWKKQQNFACRRMQRKEERRGNDAMQAEDRMKGEGCNDALLSRNSALQVEECCSEGGKNVALRGG